jgi:anti-sigma regulatory factor (Ser/Thr protein kinase)
MGFEKQAMWVLPRSTTAASESRHHLLDACRGMPQESLETAVLLTDEVVVNAVKHSEGPIALFVTRTGDRVHVEVQDANPDPPVVADTDLLAETGRGMVLVEAMARAWGARPSRPPGPGKRVWFDV